MREKGLIRTKKLRAYEWKNKQKNSIRLIKKVQMQTDF